MKKLENKIALITGAGRGIGAEISKNLAAEGATVLLASRSVDELESVAETIGELGGVSHIYPVDMSKEDSIQQLVTKVSSDFGRIDILINNAGVTHSDLLKDTSTAAWDKCMAVNAKGPFILCRECLPLMEKIDRGFIINIGSVVSIKGYPMQSAYTASKHALRGMTLSLAEECNKSHISVHMICPGGVDTSMVGDVRPDINKEELILPEEVADIVTFITTRRGRGIIDEFHLRRSTSSPWF